MTVLDALAAAVWRQAAPGLGTAGCSAVLGALQQLCAHAAAPAHLQLGPRMISHALPSTQPHVSTLSSGSSTAGEAATTAGAGTQAYTSQAASTSSVQQQSIRDARVEESIEAIRARVFEHHIGNNKRSGRRPLLKALRGSWIADWYLIPPADLPMLENPNEADRLERVGLRKAAGKAPPKKGQGKRAGKKK